MKISQERFDSIKQSPRSVTVTDVEDLCDEIECLAAENAEMLSSAQISVAEHYKELAQGLKTEVAALKEQLAAREATISRVCDAFMIGESVRNEETIMANLNNAIRRGNCLSAIEDKFFTRTLVDDEEGEFDECYLSWGATPEEYVKQFGAVLEDREAAVRRTK